jgi:hypothetical protein
MNKNWFYHALATSTGIFLSAHLSAFGSTVNSISVPLKALSSFSLYPCVKGKVIRDCIISQSASLVP